MKTINRSKSVFYQIIIIAAFFIGLFMFFNAITGCSDPIKDVEPVTEQSIVDGTPAQPEGQPHERGITIDTSR